MLSVVTFKWAQEGFRTAYNADHVNTLRRMILRHYDRPTRFICITDNESGIDRQIECVPIWNEFSDIPNPTWAHGPSCYRRLSVFRRDFRNIVGDRFVCLDLDCVITGDLSPIFDRSEDCITYRSPGLGGGINGSIFIMNTGCRAFVHSAFDPASSPGMCNRLGHKGSDQGWMDYSLRQCSSGMGPADGIHEFNALRRSRRQIVGGRTVSRPSGPATLPDGARIVFFHGQTKPWTSGAVDNAPWIRDHYR